MSSNFGRNVYTDLPAFLSSILFNLFNSIVCFSWNSHLFRLDINYDQNRIGNIANRLILKQVTELADGILIGCAVNHVVVDSTSFWNFFNTFAAHCRGTKLLPNPPDFSRDSVLISRAVLQVSAGGLRVTFSVDAQLMERIFRFNRESILKLKTEVSNQKRIMDEQDNEILGKTLNDKVSVISMNTKVAEISSFQSLCALLWRGVTRAKKLPSTKTTTFRMAVNCRHRLEPKLDDFYFGNAIQSIPTYATAGEVTCRDLGWSAEQLNKNVMAHNDGSVRQVIKDWESDPRCFPLGNFDGAMITIGSSPRFPMYENDFGWGRPLAVRSGWANKFDGKILAFPGRRTNGSVDLEVFLSPETMAGLEADTEFMQYVSEFYGRASHWSGFRGGGVDFRWRCIFGFSL